MTALIRTLLFDLVSWSGKKIWSVQQLTSLKEPAWALSGGESFLSQGPLEWFQGKKQKVEKQMTETMSALALIDENEAQDTFSDISSIRSGKSTGSNLYTQRLNKHLEELKKEKSALTGRIKQLKEKCKKEIALGADHR